jgi:large subunit ribosomal protein L4
MASVPIRDQSGKKAGTRELPGELFEATVNVPLMHQVVVAGMAAARAGTHSTKTRAEVRGGGKKPWRQKGTGRARHGSIRSPIWVGGGVSHGPKPRDHSMRVNKKMRKAALRGALTDAAQSGKLTVVSDLEFEEPSTSDAVDVLEALEINDGKKTLLVLHEPDRFTELSYRNLPHVKTTFSRSLSVYDVVAADHVLFTTSALDVLEGKEPTALPRGKGASPRAPRAESEANQAEEPDDDEEGEE